MTTKPISKEKMLIDWRTVGPFAANSYLVVCRSTGEAALIDACDRVDVLKKMIESHGASLRYILQTHAHIDHVGALADLKAWSNAPIAIHKDEDIIYRNISKQGMMFGLPPTPQPPEPDMLLKDKQILPLGQLEIKVYHTPGHTPGGLSFAIEDALFTGDLLFAGSVGRTDLPGGDFNTLIRSINRLMNDITNATVLSGHGSLTTLEQEREYNPFL